MSYFDVEPGAAGESLLLAIDNFQDEIGQQMSSSLEEIKNDSHSEETEEINNESVNISNYEDNTSAIELENDNSEVLQDQQWALMNKHIFVLSMAGKPIYSR